MIKFIRKILFTIEKTILVMSIVIAIGLFNDGNLSLQSFRELLLFSALVGTVIGVGFFLFEMEKLNIKLAYAVHFLLGYIAINIFEGVIFFGTLLPKSPPINYLFKLLFFFVAYLIITLVEIYNEKRIAKKMYKKIEKIKGNVI